MQIGGRGFPHINDCICCVGFGIDEAHSNSEHAHNQVGTEKQLHVDEIQRDALSQLVDVFRGCDQERKRPVAELLALVQSVLAAILFSLAQRKSLISAHKAHHTEQVKRPVGGLFNLDLNFRIEGGLNRPTPRISKQNEKGGHLKLNTSSPLHLLASFTITHFKILISRSLILQNRQDVFAAVLLNQHTEVTRVFKLGHLKKEKEKKSKKSTSTKSTDLSK